MSIESRIAHVKDLFNVSRVEESKDYIIFFRPNDPRFSKHLSVEGIQELKDVALPLVAVSGNDFVCKKETHEN